MSPVLSPKKSVEGAFGGIAGTFLLTALYALAFREQMGITNVQIVVLAAISTVGGVISMIGDLAASAIKRNYEIKSGRRRLQSLGNKRISKSGRLPQEKISTCWNARSANLRRCLRQSGRKRMQKSCAQK